MSQETYLQAIADAIRAKDGSADPIPANTFAERIAAIQTGVQLPALTNPGTAADLLEGKELIDQDGNPVTGTMSAKAPIFETLDSANVTLSGNILRFTVAQEIGQLLGAAFCFYSSVGANIASYPYINNDGSIQFAFSIGDSTGFADTAISGKTVTADASRLSFITFDGTFSFGCVCYLPK